MDKSRIDDPIEKPGDELLIKGNQAFLLSNLYVNKLGFDVTIKIGDKLIHGHRLILAAAIPYFAAIFLGGLTEAHDAKVVLENIDPDATEMIIEYVYTGILKINRKNWKSLLLAADCLAYQPIKDYCCNYLGKNLDLDSLFQIKHLSNVINSPKLDKIVDNFINENFEGISRRSEFLRIPFDELKNIISRNELNSPNELNIYKSLIEWIKFDLEGRRSHLAPLFKEIRLHLVSKEDLINTVSKERLIVESPECNEYMYEAISYHFLPQEKNLTKEPWTRTRSFQEEIIYITGGVQQTQSGLMIEKLKLHPFSSLLEEPPNEWLFHGTALLNNKLYLLGGGGGASITDRVVAMDLKTQGHYNVASMIMKRQRFGAVAINDKIYVCGGAAPDGTHLASVEMFNPIENKWTLKAPMSTPRCKHATVVLDGCLYAIGGRNVKSVEKYDPEKDIWSPVVLMNSSRYWHGAAVYCGKIIVAGGHTGKKTLNTAEVYDPQQGKWTSIASLNQPREDLLLLVYQSKLYAIGGKDASNNPVTSIEELRLNPTDKTFFWSKIDHEISIPRWGASAQVFKA